MPDATPVLSEREIEIMRQVVTGLSNREIARNLDISPNTVKVHLRNIFEKLEVQSRTEATLYVLREGWVQVDNRVAVLGGALTGITPIAVERDDLDVSDTEPESVDTSGDVVANGNGTLKSDAVTETAPVIITAPLVSEPTSPLTTVTDTASTTLTTSPRPVTEVLPPLATPTHRNPAWLVPLIGVGVVALLVVFSLLLWRTLTPTQTTVVPTTIANTSTVYLPEPSRWTEGVLLPTARSGVVAAKIGQNLVVAGGNTEGTPTAEVWWFDNASQTWEARAPLPEAVAGAEAVLSGGALVVAGGVDADDAPVTTVQRYSPQDDTWEEIASLPTPLARGALVAFEGSLYYIGGWDGDTIQTAILRLAPNAEEWETVSELPEPRANLAAVVLTDGILLLGGVDENERPVNDVVHFSPNASTPFREEAPLPAPDSDPRVAALGSAVYLLGVQGFLERDPDQQWRSVAPPETPLPTDSAVIASDPYIIVIGGQRGNDTVADVWQYQAIYRSFIPIVPNQGGSTTP